MILFFCTVCHAARQLVHIVESLKAWESWQLFHAEVTQHSGGNCQSEMKKRNQETMVNRELNLIVKSSHFDPVSLDLTEGCSLTTKTFEVSFNKGTIEIDRSCQSGNENMFIWKFLEDHSLKRCECDPSNSWIFFYIRIYYAIVFLSSSWLKCIHW